MAKAKKDTAPVDENLVNGVEANEEVKNETPAPAEAEVSEDNTVVSHVEEEVSNDEAPAENTAVSTETPAEEPAPKDEDVDETGPSEEPTPEKEKYQAPEVNEKEDEPLDVEKLSEEFKNPAEKIDQLNITDENAKEVVEGEINRTNELIGRLDKDIKSEEKKLTKESKGALDKIFAYGFGDFWNGVTETI